MKFNHSLIALSLLTAVAATSGCGGGSSSSVAAQTPTPAPTPTPTPTPAPTPGNGEFSFDAETMISNLTDNVIVKGYENLNLKADAFYLATVTLMETPTQDNLNRAKQAWEDARLPWEQGESHIFGPVDALSIDPHLDTWPLNTNDLQTLLNTRSGFSAAEIRTWNDDVQGFHTLEFLLFGDGVAHNNKPIAAMTQLEREYLVATAEVFKGYTQSLYKAWIERTDANDSASKPYREMLTVPGNQFYASQLSVVEELMKGLIGIVDEVGNGKIAEPFGSSVATADTSIVESQYSWNSLLDFRNNIVGVQNVYRGEFVGQSDQPGLIDFVQAYSADVAKRIDDEIVAAINAIDGIAGDNQMPFRQAIKDEQGRVRVQQAIDALTTLQASLENEGLLSLTKWKNR